MGSVRRGLLVTLCLGAIALGAPALAISNQVLSGLGSSVPAGQGLESLGDGLMLPGDGPAGGEDMGGDSLLTGDETGDDAAAAPAADHLGGLPGLDGLNASSEAVREALEDLDPVTIRLLLGRVDRAILEHIAGSLAAPLPGIDGAGATALPGLDGLPVRPRDE